MEKRDGQESIESCEHEWALQYIPFWIIVYCKRCGKKKSFILF